MRTIRVLKIGLTKDNRPYARGVTDFESSEQLAVLQLAAKAGAQAPAAAFGLIGGIPDEALARLNVGDTITAETVTVRPRIHEYVDKSGAEVNGIDCAIYLAGKASRVAAPTAQCDW